MAASTKPQGNYARRLLTLRNGSRPSSPQQSQGRRDRCTRRTRFITTRGNPLKPVSILMLFCVPMDRMRTSRPILSQNGIASIDLLQLPRAITSCTVKTIVRASTTVAEGNVGAIKQT